MAEFVHNKTCKHLRICKWKTQAGVPLVMPKMWAGEDDKEISFGFDSRGNYDVRYASVNRVRKEDFFQ